MIIKKGGRCVLPFFVFCKTVKEAFALEKRVTHNKNLLEELDSIVLSLLAIVLVFSFGVRICRVDGSSMNPGLLDGERVLISSLPYRPAYGDVVVVDSYIEYGKPLVKRVIGLPGDTIDIDFGSGVVYRNGQALDEPYTAEPTYLKEEKDFPLTVPAGSLFVMGDNRNHSLDSRSTEIGFIDERDILGKALFRIMPFNKAGAIK